MSNEELKPCPFCGSGAQLNDCLGDYWVTCNLCNASANMYSGEENAIKAWNTRNEAND